MLLPICRVVLNLIDPQNQKSQELQQTYRQPVFDPAR